MTVKVTKPAVNLREELASLRNQGGYQEQQFYFDNLVTNGTFDSDTDWTKGTGWTIGSGVATAVGAGGYFVQRHVVPSGTTKVLKATWDQVITSGTRFRFFARNAIDGGSVTVLSGSATGGGSYGSGNCTGSGTFTVYVSTTNGYAFKLLAESGNNGTVDNVSVFEIDASNDVIHTMPKGWKPKDFYEDGLLQREGAANDYTVVYDGFDYYVKPVVAPSATTQTCVIGVKA